jgi:peptide/nickel transport system ATP-binding protein
MALLEVDDLYVTFPTADGDVQAARGVSFSVEAGRTLGIVGESGSGKSVCCLTLLGLTPRADVSGHAVFDFDGVDLISMDVDELREVRGARIAMVFQDPLSSLHPYYRVGWQIAEMIREHEDVSRRAGRERAVELLAMVGIPQPDRRVDDYPHQFSGGMRQRALIAMALALRPDLLIADEPTTALDATVQAQILDLLGHLQQEFGTALVLVTHDLGVVAEVADDVVVMYAGTVVERADRRTLFYRQHHPYTRGLLGSIPAMETGASPGSGGRRLVPIAGQPPSLISPPRGCPFHPRCRFVMDRCIVDPPPLRPVGGGASHVSACFLDARLLGPAVDDARLAQAWAHRTVGVASAGGAA